MIEMKEENEKENEIERNLEFIIHVNWEIDCFRTIDLWRDLAQLWNDAHFHFFGLHVETIQSQLFGNNQLKQISSL